jgi:hypothetical protein
VGLGSAATATRSTPWISFATDDTNDEGPFVALHEQPHPRCRRLGPRRKRHLKSGARHGIVHRSVASPARTAPGTWNCIRESNSPRPQPPAVEHRPVPMDCGRTAGLSGVPLPGKNSCHARKSKPTPVFLGAFACFFTTTRDPLCRDRNSYAFVMPLTPRSRESPWFNQDCHCVFRRGLHGKDWHGLRCLFRKFLRGYLRG